MNRQEFMKRLEYLLRGIPASEREDALAYYNDYFDEAGVENEYQVILELGSPEAVAEKIVADVQQENAEKQGMSKSTKILIVILLVLTFPLWIGVVAGLFGTVVGLIGAAFGIAVGGIGTAFGLIVGGVACIVVGVARFMFAPMESLASIGVGAILTALGLLIGLLFVWCVGVWLPKLVKALISWIKGLFHRNRGGNEI